MKPLDQCLLYTFVDAAYLDGRDPVEIARQLCAGGSDLIQLRAKDWPPERIRRLAEEILPVTEAANVGLVINDYPDIAQSTGAPLCHLGQEDFFDAGHNHLSQLPTLNPELSPHRSQLRFGLSTHAPDQARRAMEAGPDYLAIGPVFATPTKPGRPGVTLDYVRWAAAHVSIPWFAIGGITLQNLDEVLATGATRVCAVSAILRAPDIAKACQQFRERLVSARV